jgi:hypothetical protein
MAEFSKKSLVAAAARSSTWVVLSAFCQITRRVGGMLVVLCTGSDSPQIDFEIPDVLRTFPCE